MKSRLVLLSGLLTLVAGNVSAQAASTPAPVDTATLRAEVIAVVNKLFDGMKKRDTAAMRSVFHPNAMLLSSSVRGGVPTISSDPIDAWISSIAKAPAGTVLDERLMNTIVHVEDGLASVWTEYELWIGERFSHCGVDAMTLGKTDAGWKMLSIADTRRRTGCRQASSR